MGKIGFNEHHWKTICILIDSDVKDLNEIICIAKSAWCCVSQEIGITVDK